MALIALLPSGVHDELRFRIGHTNRMSEYVLTLIVYAETQLQKSPTYLPKTTYILTCLLVPAPVNKLHQMPVILF